MPTTPERPYSELDDPWSVDHVNRTYTSQVHAERGDQRLIFAEPFGDGSISGEITCREGLPLAGGGVPRVATLVFRFRDAANYYFAGIGAFGVKFSIGKRVEGLSQNILGAGSSGSIEEGRAYQLTVRCEAGRITLLENGVPLLTVNDETFQAGYWGLSTWKAKAEFKNLAARPTKPRCFLIMPFGREFDFILSAIRDTVDSFDFQYDRADESFVTEIVVAKIQEQIARSDLIIADLTGKNPNVFYEVGYATALNKKMIQIAQSVADLPFDVRHLRTFPYSDKMGADAKFKQDLTRAIEKTTGHRPIVPLTGHSGPIRPSGAL